MTCTCKTTQPSLTEEAVLNPGALPPSLRGWRRYRIEYGFECSCPEGLIYLPASIDPDDIERLINSESGWDMSYAETFDKWPEEFHDGAVEMAKMDKPREWEGSVRLDGDDLVVYRDRDPVWRMTLGPQTQSYLLRALAENISKRNAVVLREWWDKESRLEGK